MLNHISVRVAALSLAIALANPARAQTERRVIFLDAATESITCIVRDAPTVTCRPNERLFLDTLHAPEMRVDHRKFFADYNVEIQGSVTIPQPRIRGIEQAAQLTFGAGTLLTPPPAKGGMATVTPKSASDLFGLLINESNADQPYAQLKADFDEITREANAVRANLTAFATIVERLVSASSRGCGVQAGDPDLPGVLNCLRRELVAETTGTWSLTNVTYGDEKEFRNVIVRVNDQIVVVKNLQRLLSDSNLVTSALSIDADLTQLEKNADAFDASLEGQRLRTTSSLDLTE